MIPVIHKELSFKKVTVSDSDKRKKVKKVVPLFMTGFFSSAITFFYLFQRQRRRFRLRAALGDLVA